MESPLVALKKKKKKNMFHNHLTVYKRSIEWWYIVVSFGIKISPKFFFYLEELKMKVELERYTWTMNH